MKPDISPEVQAVLEAVNDAPHCGSGCVKAVAALRAAVDQVISSVSPPCADFDEYAKGFLAAHVKYRRDLLAIAAELKAQQ